jgi:voltage-gated potassium channel
MVSQMVRPAVVTFLDTMLRDRGQALRFEEVAVGKGSLISGKTIAESKIGERSGALLVAVMKGETRDYEFNPSGEKRIQDGDVLVLIAGPEMMKSVEKIVREG